jgi:23S rRNA (uracil1939-C5)-methyltransferase
LSNELNITRLAYGGEGVSTLPDGKIVFVPGTVPGDKVEAEVVEEHSNYDRAVVKNIVEASENRVEAACPYSDVCGGCPWQIVEYQTQLKWKRNCVVDALGHIAGLENPESLVGPCIQSNKQWHYRNKIELVPAMSGKRLQLGYHSASSDHVVPIDECMLLPKSHQKAPKALAGALRYLKASEYGLNRVGIRVSPRTGSTQIAIWTVPGYFPRKAAANVLSGAVNNTSVVRVLVKNDAGRKPSKVELLSGTEWWNERLYDKTMGISAPSFFQVNTAGAESLVAIVMTGLDISPDETCCDLYCGAGTFTLPMAEQADFVYAVESASSSVRDLRHNLASNGLEAEVIGGDAVREAKNIGKVSKLVLDPPYSGMDKKIFEGVAELSPTRIALVSCNPTTLARDISGMIDLGYKIERVSPVDLFPQTFHVETVVLLSRG